MTTSSSAEREHVPPFFYWHRLAPSKLEYTLDDRPELLRRRPDLAKLNAHDAQKQP